MSESTGTSGEKTRSEEKPAESVQELTRTGYASAVLLSLLLLGVNFCADGCGVSRVSSYFAHYHGSAGYSHLAIAGNLNSIGEPPDSLWNNLYYGSKLSHVKEAGFDVIRSQVPAAEIEHLFIPRDLADKLKPGSAYCFHVSHVGNFYTFPFRGKYGFEAYRVHELSAQELPNIKLDEKWSAPFKIYSWCVIVLPVLFLFGIMRIRSLVNDADPSSRPAADGVSPRYLERLQRLLGAIPWVLLYLGTAAYIANLDLVDDIWPIGKILFAGLLIGSFFWVLLRKPEVLGNGAT